MRDLEERLVDGGFFSYFFSVSLGVAATLLLSIVLIFAVGSH